MTSTVWSIAVARGAEPGAYHFAVYQPSGRLITGPLEARRYDGLPDLYEVRRRLDDVADPIDHLLVAAEPIPGADELDLRAHLLVGFAGVGDEATRLMLTAQQVATLLGVSAALDGPDVRRVVEEDIRLDLPDDLGVGQMRALAWLLAGRREVERRAGRVRVIAAPAAAGRESADTVRPVAGSEQHLTTQVNRRSRAAPVHGSTTIEQPPAALTLDEVARALSVSVGQARSMLARGLIPFFRTGPGPRAPIRVLRSALDEALVLSFGRAAGGVSIQGQQSSTPREAGSVCMRGPARRPGMPLASRRRVTHDGQDLDALLAEVGLRLEGK